MIRSGNLVAFAAGFLFVTTAIVPSPAHGADDGTWSFPVGSAASGSGWFVTIGLGDSWTSSSGVSYRGHLAEDWFKQSGSSLGQPVYAAAAGLVVVLRQNCGNYVDVAVIEHDVGGELVYSLYGHVEADGYVIEGQKVVKGQQIGVIGDPVVFSPHLHFSIFNRTAFLEGPHSNCTLSNGRYVASGYSGISNDYDANLDFYDPSNDGVNGNWFYHPTRFIESHALPLPPGENVALGAINWFASSLFNSDFGGLEACDGVIAPNSKWTSDGQNPESWLALDLGARYDVTGFIVRHAGAGGEPTSYNTEAYRIEVGDTLTGPWTTLETVSNANQLSVTVTTLADSLSMRYVRIYVTDAGIDNYARIPELEIYGTIVSSPAVSVAVSVDRSSYSTGDALAVSLQVDNTGSSGHADFYFGVILSDGNTVILFTSQELTMKTVSRADLSNWSPMVPGVDLSAPFIVNKPAFFTHTWMGQENPGTYTFFLAAAVPGALADGMVNEGDVIHASTATFVFMP